MPNKEGERCIILFDGVCNLCDTFVNFVFDRDSNKRFNYASLQSETGRQLLIRYSVPLDLKTVVLIEEIEGNVYLRSSAALRVLSYLNYPWNLLYGCMCVPPFVRDIAYKIVANNRYSLFGKHEACSYKPGLRKQFLNWGEPVSTSTAECVKDV